MDHLSPKLAKKLQKYGYITEPSLDYMLSRLDEYGYYPDVMAIRPNHYECVLNRINNFVNELEPLCLDTFAGSNRKDAVAKALLWVIEHNRR